MRSRRGFSGFVRGTVAWLVPALVIVSVASPSASGELSGPVTTSGRVVDPACRGGAGVVMALPRAWLADGPSVVTTMLPHGITLVVVTSVFPDVSYALVRAFTSTCALDSSFGDKGAEKLALGGHGFSITAAAPAIDGGAVLAGHSAGGWLVAHMEPNGQIDHAFGKGGWTVLPWLGGPTAVTQEPSGDIFLGGSLVNGNGPMGIGGLNGRGALLERFGRHGLVKIPETMDDSELARVAIESNGDILGLVLGGNMGAWGVTVDAFRPDGSPVPSFKRNFSASLQHAAPQVFVADLIVRPSGFLLVGTRQSVPVTPRPSRTAMGRVVAFEPSGRLDTGFARHGVDRFVSPLENPVWALPQQNGGVLIVGQTPYLQASPKTRVQLRLLGISSNGAAEAGYTHGPAHLELPFLGQSFPASAIPVTIATNGQKSVVVSSTADGKELRLVELLG